MESLFDVTTYNNTIERLNKLTPETVAKWGRMNVAQMLAHCVHAFKVPLSDKKMKRSVLGIMLAWAFKEKLYNDEHWKKSLPTSPDFRIEHECDFEKEKSAVLESVTKFYKAGPMGAGRFPHPFFGSFTPEQWGKSMFKHMDHHLRQFGV